MKRKPGREDWLPPSKRGKAAPAEPTGEAFRPEWIDFERGIRVGNLEPHERITQILKHHLEQRFATPFVTDRWGRGVYWQWICWVSKANRQVKPLSSGVNFGCAKLFISADRTERVFQSGLQVERGYAGSSPWPGNTLETDWDWHRLMAECRPGSALDGELHRLLEREGFVAEIGDFERNAVFRRGCFSSAAELNAAAALVPGDRWAGFQLYFPMPASEVQAGSGHELVRAIEAVFDEVVPAMNLCMQVPLQR